jgi:hypothetical protein
VSAIGHIGFTKYNLLCVQSETSVENHKSGLKLQLEGIGHSLKGHFEQRKRGPKVPEQIFLEGYCLIIQQIAWSDPPEQKPETQKTKWEMEE